MKGIKFVILGTLIGFIFQCKPQIPAHHQSIFYGETNESQYKNDFFNLSFDFGDWEVHKRPELPIFLDENDNEITDDLKHPYKYRFFELRKQNPGDNAFRSFSISAVKASTFRTFDDTKGYVEYSYNYFDNLFNKDKYSKLLSIENIEEIETISSIEFELLNWKLNQKIGDNPERNLQIFQYSTLMHGYYLTLGYSSPIGDEFFAERDALLSSIDFY